MVFPPLWLPAVVLALSTASGDLERDGPSAAVVTSVTRRSGAQVPVYNLKIADHRNYVVGEGSLLVHNNSHGFSDSFLRKIVLKDPRVFGRGVLGWIGREARIKQAVANLKDTLDKAANILSKYSEGHQTFVRTLPAEQRLQFLETLKSECDHYIRVGGYNSDDMRDIWMRTTRVFARWTPFSGN